MTSSLSPVERQKRNQLHQKHQIAQEIAAEEEIIRHLEFGAKTLYVEMECHKRKLEALTGRGGA